MGKSLGEGRAGAGEAEVSQQVPQEKGEEQRHEGDDDKPEVVEEAQHQMGRQWEGARLQKQEETQKWWKRMVSPQRR